MLCLKLEQKFTRWLVVITLVWRKKKLFACKSLEEEIILLHSQEMLFLEARKLCYKVKIMRFLKCVFFAIFFFAQHTIFFNFFFKQFLFLESTLLFKNQYRDKVQLKMTIIFCFKLLNSVCCCCFHEKSSPEAVTALPASC